MNEGIGPQMHSSSWVAATPPWSTPIFLRSCAVTLQNVDSERARKSPVSARMMSPATSPALSAGGLTKIFSNESTRLFPGRSGIASVFSSSTKTNPAGSPLADERPNRRDDLDHLPLVGTGRVIRLPTSSGAVLA
jgi:hypothetical protein